MVANTIQPPRFHPKSNMWTIDYNEPVTVRCDGCGNEIDPTTCHCGDPMESHSAWSSGHSPVPMGCDCMRDKTKYYMLRIGALVAYIRPDETILVFEHSSHGGCWLSSDEIISETLDGHIVAHKSFAPDGHNVAVYRADLIEMDV